MRKRLNDLAWRQSRLAHRLITLTDNVGQGVRTGENRRYFTADIIESRVRKIVKRGIKATTLVHSISLGFLLLGEAALP